MLPTSIPRVLLAFLVILQTLISVSALPVSTTTTTSANTELEARGVSSHSSGGSSRSNVNNNNSGTNSAGPLNTTTSNKVTASQIAGVVIGALCTIALALIFWYCLVQHRRRKLEQRAIQEKIEAIENTKRADPSYDYPGSSDAKSRA